MLVWVLFSLWYSQYLTEDVIVVLALEISSLTDHLESQAVLPNASLLFWRKSPNIKCLKHMLNFFAF